jgi:hypothetical protein
MIQGTYSTVKEQLNASVTSAVVRATDHAVTKAVKKYVPSIEHSAIFMALCGTLVLTASVYIRTHKKNKIDLVEIQETLERRLPAALRNTRESETWEELKELNSKLLGPAIHRGR